MKYHNNHTAVLLQGSNIFAWVNISISPAFHGRVQRVTPSYSAVTEHRVDDLINCALQFFNDEAIEVERKPQSSFASDIVYYETKEKD